LAENSITNTITMGNASSSSLTIKPRIKFMFDYGCSPLWFVDDTVADEFGYNIDEFKKLGLSQSTIQLIELNCAFYESQLNPVYQGYPSFWSGRMHVFFQSNMLSLLEVIKNEIGHKYDVENHQSNAVNVQMIDAIVSDFVQDPVAFSVKNGITFQSAGNLQSAVAQAHKTWVEKEAKLFS